MSPATNPRSASKPLNDRPESVSFFNYQNGQLYLEQVQLNDVVARFGTPCYVYSKACIEANFAQYRTALAHRNHKILYAVKANSNLAILQLLAKAGAGFDIVSGGELARVLMAGGNAADTAFAGVGKTRAEIEYALAQGIGCFNVESTNELKLLSQVATAMGRTAPIAIRINPDVDPKTHPYIATGLRENKFGIPIDDGLEVYRLARSLPGLEITGVCCHIGSQLTDLTPYLDAVSRVISLVDSLAADGIHLHHLDVGGGVGIGYVEDAPKLSVGEFCAAMDKLVDRRLALHMEPGRSIVGAAGTLLTEVVYLKQAPERRFAVVDAAMNDLMRPALYQAWHRIVPLTQRNDDGVDYDIVGPVCESADVLGRSRRLAIAEGDCLAILDAGAYGFVMASNYNTRPRPPEVLVDGGRANLVRQREQFDDLVRGEQLLG
ncbi:MAG: diaminopimelate decarboxylase [Gammaproteobacteria bacterium]|nr:diaminopimelate decarboxylase [Gammaproteobacteria bacterium]